ncbi:MAG: hypothetical protein JXB05_28030 [Myxococcaceae bacterium]|nr:hypothetical protein [Myxococcaceae bacterium]
MTLYNKFQLIAYHVPTDRPFKTKDDQLPQENRLPAGKPCPIESDRLKDLEQELANELSADALSRLKRMIAVVEKASASPLIDPTANTLKIFMAPEFYFRPEAKGNASWSYTQAEKGLIEQALKKVFSDEKKYASWLLVLGTIVWNQKASDFLKQLPQLDNAQDPALAKIGDAPLLWNAALVMEGGTNTLASLNKKLYSGADDIEPEFQPNAMAKDKTKLDQLEKKNAMKVRDYLQTFKNERQLESIFPVGDNLTVSLEICADHASGMANLAYKKLKKKYPQVDLQLVTACSVRVQQDVLVIGKDQFVLRMDGAGTLTPEWPGPWDQSEIQKVLSKVNEKCVTSARYDRDNLAAQKSQVWKDINVVEDEILLDGALKLDTGNLVVRRLKEDNQGLHHAWMSVDEAFPQKLVIYQPRDFEHGLVKGDELPPQGVQQDAAPLNAAPQVNN